MKNPGKLVQHDDGRVGIAYNADQKQKQFGEEKAIVRFYESPEKLSDQKRSVAVDKLRVIGFVD